MERSRQNTRQIIIGRMKSKLATLNRLRSQATEPSKRQELDDKIADLRANIRDTQAFYDGRPTSTRDEIRAEYFRERDRQLETRDQKSLRRRKEALRQYKRQESLAQQAGKTMDEWRQDYWKRRPPGISDEDWEAQKEELRQKRKDAVAAGWSSLEPDAPWGPGKSNGTEDPGGGAGAMYGPVLLPGSRTWGFRT